MSEKIVLGPGVYSTYYSLHPILICLGNLKPVPCNRATVQSYNSARVSMSIAPNLDGDRPDNGYEAIWKA